MATNQDKTNHFQTAKEIAFKSQRIEEINSYFKLFGAIVFCVFIGTNIYIKGADINSTWNILNLTGGAIFGFSLPVLSIPVGLIGSIINILNILK